jgi:diguanylate cyclase (GGDEF)-like protein/PAS domain S-box-containing protein
MNTRRSLAFRPLETRGRRTMGAILLTFALFSAIGITLSIHATARSKHQATVVRVASRQRTLAERYVKEVLLVHRGMRADPTLTARLLAESARVLLDGGVAPSVNGDDDETSLAPTVGATARAQLAQARRLVADLNAVGSAYLAHGPVDAVRLTAHEHLQAVDPVMRLRILAALTSNVSLDAVRTIAGRADHNIGNLITIQIVLGIAGFLTSVLLALGLIATTRRQTAHFRSLVTSSTDLVLVFGPEGCRYVSQSVGRMVDCPETDLLGAGFEGFIHPDDLKAVDAAIEHGAPAQVLFRLVNRFGEWRNLEANVTDLRTERQIRGVVLNARDVTERVRLEEELTRQAFHDGLTDLANRALFRDRLDHALEQSVRSHTTLAVLLVDLDGFKQVNDSLGHDAGDHLLQQVAGRFATVTRPGDTLARLGGDEFALLIEGANEQMATAVARRLLLSLADPIEIADRSLRLGASIGVVTHEGDGGASERLIRDADLAMYAAKEAGRGRYEVFRYEMARELGELLGLEHELRLGLERGEFELHYQPLVDLETRAFVGAEGLLRWQSPSRGLVEAERFIPVAEATGLIMELGEFVLREACRQTAAWDEAGTLPEEFVTWVNVSGKQVSGGGLEARVTEELARAGVPGSRLGLEVTETAVVLEGPAGDRARAELRNLHALGVRIAIDDFGTGFSSLGHLRRFPVDVIKVDRSFVQGVEHNAKDAAITANLASLAHALGLVAIAEGIESQGQLAAVRELGCDHAQGFLFAHPLPAVELGRLLAGEEPTFGFMAASA